MDIMQKINNDFKNSFTKSNSVKRNNSFKIKYDRNKESGTIALTNYSSSKRLSKNSFNNNPIITTEFNLPNNNIPKRLELKILFQIKKLKSKNQFVIIEMILFIKDVLLIYIKGIFLIDQRHKME